MKGINWSDHILNFAAVILGVSLAFIVSNKAEEAKLNKETALNLQTILEEIKNDVETYESYQVPYNKDKLSQMNKAVEQLSMESYNDSSLMLLYAFFDVNNYSPANVTLSSLISSGKLDLINDYELKKELLNYQNLAKELMRQGDFQVDYLMDKILPWFFVHPDILTNSEEALTALDDKNRSQLIVILSFYTSFVEGKIEKYEVALEDGRYLKEKIESYQNVK